MNRILTALFALLLVSTLAACEPAPIGSEAPSDDESAEAETTPPAAEPADATASGSADVEVAGKAPYGRYLTDAEGRALYLFTADTQGETSACVDACAEAWPPLIAEGGDPEVASALDPTLVGTVERPDGEMQVTYNGWPLYHYAEDSGRASTSGQDVHEHGGEWYLVSPEGERIESAEEQRTGYRDAPTGMDMVV